MNDTLNKPTLDQKPPSKKEITTMAPAVDKATTADLDGIVNVFMDAFSDDFFLELFPRENGVCKDWKSKAWSRFLQWREAGIQEAQVYVVKNDEGEFFWPLIFHLWLGLKPLKNEFLIVFICRNRASRHVVVDRQG